MDVFNDILNEPLSHDTEQLKQFVAKAREAETKTKMQIYTIRGQKGLAALKHSYVPDEDEPQPDIYDIEKSPQIIELRRQIQLMKEMEQAQLDEIERLKQEKALREAQQQPSLQSYTSGIIENPQIQIEQARELQIESSVAVYQMEVATPVAITVPQFVSQAAPVAPVSAVMVSAPVIPNVQPVEIAQPVPPVHSQSMGEILSPRNMLSNAFNSTSAGSTPNINPQGGSAIRNKKGKAKMPAPQAVVMKVLNASWDTGSSKSKKNNKVYTIQVTINQTTWKIIRGDDALVELSKKLAKYKGEGQPLPPLVKKVVKREQQNELATSVEQYFNALAFQGIFNNKKESPKLYFMKFFAPFSPRDEGQGNYPGPITDVEAWFLWKLGLA